MRRLGERRSPLTPSVRPSAASLRPALAESRTYLPKGVRYLFREGPPGGRAGLRGPAGRAPCGAPGPAPRRAAGGALVGEDPLRSHPCGDRAAVRLAEPGDRALGVRPAPTPGASGAAAAGPP